MSSTKEPGKDSSPEDFAREARAPERSFIGELFSFLRHNRKWWLIPVIAVLLLLGVVGVLGGTALAPFIYALF